MTAPLFALTGAPGTGKTATLERLVDEVAVVPEPARVVLAEERARGGDGVPDRDPARFVTLLLERSIETFSTAARTGRTTVFDRGIPDCMAYAAVLGVDDGPSGAAARALRYRSPILLLEPWQEIYATDDERTMSFADTIPFHEAIVEAYERVGYRTIVVPRAAVDVRAAFVLDAVRRAMSSGRSPGLRTGGTPDGAS